MLMLKNSRRILDLKKNTKYGSVGRIGSIGSIGSIDSIGSSGSITD